MEAVSIHLELLFPNIHKDGWPRPFEIPILLELHKSYLLSKSECRPGQGRLPMTRPPFGTAASPITP